MKPTSIIFLIFSIVLVIAGYGLCSMAETVAEKDNYDLFIQEQTEDGNLITTFPISADLVTKLDLSFTSTTINVISGSEEPRVELVNFPINTFTSSTASGVMSISDATDLFTLFNLTGKGTQFHGLRHYLNTANFKPGQRSVNVYLTADTALEELAITAVSSDIVVSGTQTVLSYKLTTDKGSITLNNVISADKADLSITQEGDVRIQYSSIASINATIEVGDCSFIAQQANVQTYSASTEIGAVFVDGNDVGMTYTATSALTSVNCLFQVKQGDIIISELS